MSKPLTSEAEELTKRSNSKDRATSEEVKKQREKYQAKQARKAQAKARAKAFKLDWLAVVFGLFFFAEAFTNHISTDNCQKYKGYPMVIILDIINKLITNEITYKRHQALKEPEHNSHKEKATPINPAYTASLGKRDCKAVHCQTERQKYESDYIHTNV